MLPFIIALGLVLILLAVLVAGQPDEFIVTRSAVIPAPPEKIFSHVNDLHKWEAWSPWAKLDSNSKSSFTGPDSGEGAVMRWEGNSKVGVGTMTIIDSKTAESITLRLDFEKPMKATNTAIFTFSPNKNGTLVSWTMRGKNQLPGKIFGLLVNCEKMVGGQFEQGLANLVRVVS